MAKRDLSAMITHASSDLEPVRKRGRGLDGLVSDTAVVDHFDGAIVSGDDTTLSEAEASELASCERIIERGLRTFLEVGTALVRIRDLRLYRTTYPTFDAYYRDRWSLERSQVYRLMDAAEVTRNLQSSPAGEVVLPTHERHVRPLTKLKDPQQQQQAWQTVVERSNTLGQRITATLVDTVVQEIQAHLGSASLTEESSVGTDPSSPTRTRQDGPSQPEPDQADNIVGESVGAQDAVAAAPQVAIPNDAPPAMDVSALQQRVAELEQQRDSLAAALRAAGWQIESPDLLGHVVEGLLTERAVVGERWRAINDLLHDHAGWLAQARQQTDDGHGGQLGQTMRKLLALVDAIAAKVS